MATGSGKTFVAARVAERLRAGRVLVVVPTLDLLVQMVGAWRAAGRRGPVIGVCSLRASNGTDFACTTDVDELVEWSRGLEQVLVIGTYASLGLGTLQRAHAAGLAAWDLVVVDEAHRTSGHAGKAWAAVHDNARIPAARRLYMTATPRVWAPPDAEAGQESAGFLVASMEDDAEGPFGAVSYRLSLGEAIERGIVAPYEVVVMDICDPALQAAQLLGRGALSDEVRGERLAALQAATLTACAEENLDRVLTFHHRVSEAEAFTAGLPAAAARLWETNPGLHPHPARVWASWLCGEHPPAQRRRVLDEFASGVAGDGAVMDRSVLASVRVLGEGVDTKECDGVVFADVRGSMVDIVQAVGRALRMQPGQDKVASLLVPVFLGHGEQPGDSMLTSTAYAGLIKILTALRAHDAEAVELLAVPQAQSKRAPAEPDDEDQDGLAEDDDQDEGPASRAARNLLKFSTPRDAAELADFVRLRILTPEGTAWLAGYQAATAYRAAHGDLDVPTHHTTEAGYPLGGWLANQRRLHRAGDLAPERAERLEALGVTWSPQNTVWDQGLAAATGWAAQHGHLLAPTNAVWNGYPVGEWLRNQRRFSRLETGTLGALTEERREALEAIYPAWCPIWGTTWQLGYHLVQQHLAATGTLPTGTGHVVQGVDLGDWTTKQRTGWTKLVPGQQWLLEHVLGLTPATESELAAVPRRRTQGDKWNNHLTAAQQYHQREGHLVIPRKHTETVDGLDYKIGAWVANQRARQDKLTSEQRAALDALGMRW